MARFEPPDNRKVEPQDWEGGSYPSNPKSPRKSNWTAGLIMVAGIFAAGGVSVIVVQSLIETIRRCW